MNILAVFIGGGIGSVLRYFISLQLDDSSPHFPLATFVSNLLACLTLAFIVKLGIQNKLEGPLYPMLATGFCGGFSTFSTFSLENIKLIQQGLWTVALVNVLVSVLVCGGVMFWVLKSEI